MKDDEELQIGESIGNLSELTQLTINGAELLKCLPKSMAALKKLQKLILENCVNLPDNFEVFVFTSTFTCLELLDCEITSFPISLTFLYHLTSLSLFECEFLTELPSSLSLLRRLTRISLMYCERLQSLPYTMAKLLNLKKLSIKGCASLTELPDYLKVTHLKLINSSINFIPSYLINLHHLHVSVDFLLEASFENLQNSVYLQHLSIECDDSEVEDEIPKLTAISNQFVNLPSLSLESLLLCECVQFPVNLDGLDELILLDISWTKINYIPWTLADLKKLRFLLLPAQFRLELLPFHLNDSVLISLQERQSRKTWQEVKQGLNLPVVSARDPSILSPPGYIPLQQDLGQWICDNYKSRDKSEPSGKLSNITQLYISHCRDNTKLPLTITGLKNLSIEYCGLEFHSGNLAKLYNLETLDLIHTVLPTNMDYPIGLRHLVLNGISISSLPDNIAQLSNLITLEIFECNSLKSLPTNLNIVRLKLDRIITTLPVSLLHLEIFHIYKLTCWDLKKCLTPLVKLETLYITSYYMESFPSIARQHKLKMLQLIDCFSLRQLPPDLGELMELDTLNISGTKIKSLPDSIMELPKLQHLILPRCFKQESLPKNLQGFIIDNTSEIYYKHVFSTYEGYDVALEEKDGWKKFGNEFFSSFHEDLVSCVVPFIERYSMVKGDGNCGFRAIAVFEYCDEEKWLDVRQDLKEELTTHEELYKRALGGEEELKKARDIVDWYESPAPMKHWHDITRLGLVVATKYQKICTYWTKAWPVTILPLESRTVDQHPTEYINLASIWVNHMIPLQLRTRDLPLPPLIECWENHCNTAVKSWFMSHFKKQLDYCCQLLALDYFLAHPELWL